MDTSEVNVSPAISEPSFPPFPQSEWPESKGRGDAARVNIAGVPVLSLEHEAQASPKSQGSGGLNQPGLCIEVDLSHSNSG